MNLKRTKKSNYKFKPMAPFKSYEEEANFWDTHDVTELWKPETVRRFGNGIIADVDPKKVRMAASMTIRLQGGIQRKLEAAASRMGLSVSSLARMWLIEKLRAVRI